MRIENNEQKYYLSFAAAMYKQLLSIQSFDEFQNHLYSKHKYKDKFIINYAGPQQTFDTVSISDILKKDYDFSSFNDKILLVGPTYSASQDFFSTPFNKKVLQNKKLKKLKNSGNTYTPGVEIHANVLNTLINTNNLKKFEINYFTFLTFFLILCILMIPKLKLRYLSLSFILSFFFILSLSFWTFLNTYIFETVHVAFLISTLFISSIAFKILFEKIEQLKIKNMFGKYLDKKIIDNILNNKKELKPGGDAKKVSVLFSDIANFTSISEKYSAHPEKVVSFLNEYFNEMVEIVTEKNGFVDKFIGDAVMAVFGFPIEVNISDPAVIAAVLMKKKIFVFRQKFKEDFDFNVRIGINTGIVLIGNIGSLKRMEFTVIGDNVNLASRLEGVNKIFGTNILISEFTYDLLQNKDHFFIRELDLIKVKGKEKPVRIYEVFDFYDDNDTERIKLFSDFAYALDLYRNKNFVAAKKIFAENKDDFASRIYVERCDNFIDNPPDNNWDKVFTLTKK